METRKVVQFKGTSYISIPKEICKALDIRAGEHLKISYIMGMGIFITQMSGADKIPVLPRSIEGLQKSADSICSQTEKKLKNISDTSIKDYFTGMMQQLSRLGIFELKNRVDRMERLAVESKIEKGKLTLIREHKKSAQLKS